MSILRKREKKVEEAEAPVDAVVVLILPGHGVRIVHGARHQILMLIEDAAPDLMRDFSAKSGCTAWVVDFTDPELPARIEAWRNA